VNRLLSKALILSALALTASVSQAAIVVSFGGTDAGADGITSSVAGATVFNFNNGTLPTGYTGGMLVSGSVSGQYVAPLGDTTPYLTAGSTPAPGGTVNAYFGPATYNYFGLYWGSIDTWNTVRFFLNDVDVGGFTGEEVMALGNGSTQRNRYVNFTFDSGGFNGVVLLSTQPALESDNHAIAQVPEPVTLGLLGLGLMGLGFARRRCTMS
jgi:hypothetical protein